MVLHVKELDRRCRPGVGADQVERISTFPPQPYRDPTQAELCAAWLQGYLSECDQPVKPKEIVHLAEQAGYSRGVLYRARDLLGDAIADTHPKRHPDNRWTLAG